MKKREEEKKRKRKRKKKKRAKTIDARRVEGAHATGLTP
jgi:hypothetical protein